MSPRSVGGAVLREAPLLLLVIRPLCGLIALAGSRSLGGRERLFVAFFGVRGIGSLYYMAVILGSGALANDEGREVFWTVGLTVMASIALHGVLSAPLERRLLKTTGRE